MNSIVETPKGLYCPAGDFYVDPWRSVPRAVITHAHSDHARPGSHYYLAAKAGDAILRLRLGQDANLQFAEYGEVLSLGGAHVSLHPAGHMTGAAQVRIEVAGHVTVITGDYKLQKDATCQQFEPQRCHTFVTESTFGLPIFSWSDTDETIASIAQWWRENQLSGRCSVLYAYTVGKAQRLLASVDSLVGPIYAHGSILNACRAYRECNVQLPELRSVFDAPAGMAWHQALVIAPPSVQNSTWLKRFGECSSAIASGWMRVRGIRRRRSVDRGFVISDHVDWKDLHTAIRMAECEEVWVTHGYTRQVVQSLLELGMKAREVKTEFSGDEEVAGELTGTELTGTELTGTENKSDGVRGDGSRYSYPRVQPKSPRRGKLLRRAARGSNMKQFAELFSQLDQTTKTNRKLELLEAYFKGLCGADAAWALYFLCGHKLKRLVKTKTLRQAASELVGIADWLFDECYEVVGDLAETLSLVVEQTKLQGSLDQPGCQTCPAEASTEGSTREPEGTFQQASKPLSQWIVQIIQPLSQQSEAEQKKAVQQAWLC